jgi:LysM repeat protein
MAGACAKKAPTPPPSVTPKPDSADVRRCLTGSASFKEGYRYHVLEEGQTLYRVSRMYNVTVEELIAVNGISDYTDIPAGTMLRIPGTLSTSALIWPLPGKLSSGYGKRGKRYHWGIDIPAPKGTPIRAAADGLILVSAYRMRGYRGYGRIVLIDHGSGMRTLYAHNSQNDVRAGECIRAGETIGRVGATGNATGNHLHFEIRKNGKPVNPLNYLP